MRPLRRKKMISVTDDPLTGKERILRMDYEADVYSDQGSVDTLGKQKLYFNDCGCDGPPAGRCYECGNLSCASCHGRCQSCQPAPRRCLAGHGRG